MHNLYSHSAQQTLQAATEHNPGHANGITIDVFH